MRHGKLNKRIVILRYEDEEDVLGGTEVIPKEFLKCWAAIEPLRGREYYEAQRLKDADNFKVTIRYRRNITADMLIRYGNQTFQIQTVTDPYEAHEELELYCILKKRGKGVTTNV